MASSELQLLQRQKEKTLGLHKDPPHSHSASAPALRTVVAAKPGGPWICRESKHLTGEKRAPPEPPNEAGAVAWRAARKATLHGIIGTGNRVSSVIQYPVASRDPLNLAQSRKNHLSAEDRRILRVMVKHHMRKQRGTSAFNDSVLMVEKQLLKGFAADESLCMAFYSNEAYAHDMLENAAKAVEMSLAGAPPAPAQPPKDCSHVRLIPGRHGDFCGPQCYCLRYQDVPLSSTQDSREAYPELWQESFAKRSQRAAKELVGNVSLAASGTLRPHRQH
eukprot:TRINITY_DN10346_c0_g1_i1.p1 TRINITY_DN10346_c0_g1~~TRINITY_DN10346_c0_g1_i1.p1  ORF type:complete len:286 (+),score=43.86 TRINITY_DN10346_c0_g1_i1:29-859(+)